MNQGQQGRGQEHGDGEDDGGEASACRVSHRLGCGPLSQCNGKHSDGEVRRARECF